MNKNKHRSNITGRMIVVTVVGVMLLTLIFAVVFILCKKNMGGEHTKELYGFIASLLCTNAMVEKLFLLKNDFWTSENNVSLSVSVECL